MFGKAFKVSTAICFISSDKSSVASIGSPPEDKLLIFFKKRFSPSAGTLSNVYPKFFKVFCTSKSTLIVLGDKYGFYFFSLFYNFIIFLFLCLPFLLTIDYILIFV